MIEITTEKIQMACNIRDAVLELYGVSIDVINTKSRYMENSFMRHKIYYVIAETFSRLDTKINLKTIGEIVGAKRNHSTVVHGIKSIRNQMDVDKMFAKEMNRLVDTCVNCAYDGIPGTKGVYDDAIARIKKQRDMSKAIRSDITLRHINKSLDKIEAFIDAAEK